MSISITKREANDIATNLATEFPTKIMNEFVTPALSAYNSMKGDWSGAAAKERLPIVEAFIKDLGTLKVHVSQLGAEISKKIVSLDEGDLAAAGMGAGSSLAVATANTEEVTVETAEIDPNFLHMTDATVSAGAEINALANKIQSLRDDINGKKDELSGFWQSGGEIDVIVNNIDESLEKLSSFENKAKELTESIQASQKIIKEMSQ